MQYIPVNREGIDLSILEEEADLEQEVKRRRIDLKDNIEPTETTLQIPPIENPEQENKRKKRLLIMKIRSFEQRFGHRLKDLEIPENLQELSLEELVALSEDIYIALSGQTNMAMMEKMVYGGTRFLEEVSCKAGFDVRGLSVDLCCDPKAREVLDLYLIDNMDLFVVQPRTALAMTVGSLWLQRYKINRDAEYTSRLLEIAIDERDFVQYDDL